MSRTAVFVTAAAVLGVFAFLSSPSTSLSTGSSPSKEPAQIAGPVAKPLESNVPPPSDVTATKDAPVQLTAKLSHPKVTNGVSEVYAEISLQAAQAERGPRKPVSLALVIDRSGSMHGEKLQRAKEAALNLVSQLDASDRLSIIHYGGDVKALPSLVATEANKERMRAFVATIVDDGDTNISAGLERATMELSRTAPDFAVNRIILVSDGQPTSGLVSPSSLVGLVESMRNHGFTVSALGVGADFNENLMAQLANNGGGFYGYIQSSERLAEVFSRELLQATSTVAKSVSVTLQVPEGVEVLDVFGQQVLPGSSVVTVPLYDLAAGQSAKVLARLRVNAPSGSGRLPVVEAQLGYRTVSNGELVSAKATATAAFTPDKAAVAAAMDKQVAADGVKALGAVTLTKAAVAYQEGRTTEAAGLFDNVRQLFGTSADALGGETTIAVQGVAEVQKNLQGATSPDQVNQQVKWVQRKGLQDFGNSNTY